MSNVVSLNRVRKKKAKAEKEKRAETNRRLHGRTKAERAAEAHAKAKAEKKLEGARLLRTAADGDAVPTARKPENEPRTEARVLELRPPGSDKPAPGGTDRHK